MKNVTFADYATFKNAVSKLTGVVVVFVNTPGYFQAASVSAVSLCYLFSAIAQPQTWALDFPLALQVDAIES